MLKRMLIERGAMGQKKEVKLEDIADSLGVSIVTVSNALKGKKGVSEGCETESKRLRREWDIKHRFMKRKKRRGLIL